MSQPTISVTFIDPDGASRTLDLATDASLMERSRAADVEGIIGECGGAMACGTCHCYIAAPFADRCPPRTDAEAEMLEFAFDVRPESRLSCQIPVVADLDGLVVELPARQV